MDDATQRRNFMLYGAPTQPADRAESINTDMVPYRSHTYDIHEARFTVLGGDWQSQLNRKTATDWKFPTEAVVIDRLTDELHRLNAQIFPFRDKIIERFIEQFKITRVCSVHDSNLWTITIDGPDLKAAKLLASGLVLVTVYDLEPEDVERRGLKLLQQLQFYNTVIITQSKNQVENLKTDVTLPVGNEFLENGVTSVIIKYHLEDMRRLVVNHINYPQSVVPEAAIGAGNRF